MKILTGLFALNLVCSSAYAGYTISDGRLVNSKYIASESVQEHYSKALDAYQNGKWNELLYQAQVLQKNFPETPFANEATFFLGVANYHNQEFEFASKQFSSYLNSKSTPRYFEEAIQYKFLMANQYREGVKKHLFGWQGLPKWSSAQEEALSLYDEVISALPSHELAAQALYGKAMVHIDTEEYKSAIESYQNLIRRFPKHHLAPACYLGIANAYLKQCNPKSPDVNLMDLAEINLNKFQSDFPSDNRVNDARKSLSEMTEIYATHLLDTGRFYERTKKKKAAVIYYAKVVSEYGDTDAAKKAEERLEKLGVDKDQVLKDRKG